MDSEAPVNWQISDHLWKRIRKLLPDGRPPEATQHEQPNLRHVLNGVVYLLNSRPPAQGKNPEWPKWPEWPEWLAPKQMILQWYRYWSHKGVMAVVLETLAEEDTSLRELYRNWRRIYGDERDAALAEEKAALSKMLQEWESINGDERTEAPEETAADSDETVGELTWLTNASREATGVQLQLRRELIGSLDPDCLIDFLMTKFDISFAQTRSLLGGHITMLLDFRARFHDPSYDREQLLRRIQEERAGVADTLAQLLNTPQEDRHDDRREYERSLAAVAEALKVFPTTPPQDKEGVPVTVDLRQNQVMYLGVVYDVDDDVAMFLEALVRFGLGETVSFSKLCKIHPDLKAGNSTRTRDKILKRFPGLIEPDGKKGYRFSCRKSP